MPVTITKRGNLVSIDNGVDPVKEVSILSMIESFLLDTTTSPIGVSSRTLNYWKDNTPLSDFTIAGVSGMTTVADFDGAITTLTQLSTS